MRNPELVALAARLDVVVWRVERDLRIDAQRHARAYPAFTREPIDQPNFCFALGIQKQNVGVDRFGELTLRFSNATEYDVGRREARAQRAIELAAGHDVDSR